MYKNQAICVSYELTLTDPIDAQVQALEMLRLFQAPTSDKQKIKFTLFKAMKKTQTLNQTFIASVYRQALGRMEQ